MTEQGVSGPSAPDPATVAVTEATRADLDEAVDLFMAYLDFYEVERDRAEVERFVRDRHRDRACVLLVARHDRPDGGSALLGLANVCPTYSTLSLAPVWVLNDLFVAPAARRTGVARMLLHAVQEHARRAGAVTVTLETAIDNAGARALYEAEGFTADRDFVHYSAPVR